MSSKTCSICSRNIEYLSHGKGIGDALDFWERLESLVDSRSNRKAVMAEAGIALNSISTWKKRGTYPASDVAVKIAKALGVTVEYLILGEAPVNDPWAVAHSDFINDIKILPVDQQTFIIEGAKAQAEKVRALREGRVGKSSPSA